MGNCYSGDHIAVHHKHSDIATCNTEEPQQKCPHGTVSNRLLGCAWGEGLGHVKLVLLDPNPHP